jgi:hypothetical protein
VAWASGIEATSGNSDQPIPARVVRRGSPQTCLFQDLASLPVGCDSEASDGAPRAPPNERATPVQTISETVGVWAKSGQMWANQSTPIIKGHADQHLSRGDGGI